MKKYTVLGLSTFFLVLLFQNCGKPPANLEGENQVGVVSAGQQYNKYSVGEFSTLSLFDSQNYRFLDLDMKTGRIMSFEQGGQIAGETFQLEPAKLDELKAIINSAEICEPVINPAELEGKACTMAYTYPYAIMMDRGEEVRLGEKSNGCDVPADLCGEHAKLLKSWVSSVIQSL